MNILWALYLQSLYLQSLYLQSLYNILLYIMTTTYKNKKQNKSIKSSTIKNNKTKKNKKTTSSNQLIIKKEYNVSKNIQCEDIPFVKGLKSFNTYLSNLPKDQMSYFNMRKKYGKDLLSASAPKNITPNDDFYNFVNYSWINDIQVQKEQSYITQVDDFRLTQDKVFTELNEIILDYIRNNNNDLAKNMKNFYNSVVNMNKQSETKILAKEAIAKIDELRKDKKNMWKMLALVNKTELMAFYAPFYWYVAEDDKDPSKFRCYIEPHKFLNINLDLFYDDGKNVNLKKKQKEDYNHLIKTVFDTLLGPNDLKSTDIFEVNKDMFNTFYCPDLKIKKDPTYNNKEIIYTRVYAKEAMEKYGFNWDEFSKELGFKKTPPFFITSSLSFLKCNTKLFVEQWDSEKWRPWWIWIHLKTLCRMTAGWESIIFDYFGKSQRGQEKMVVSDAVSSGLYMALPFNSFLTNEYIKKYENKQIMDFTSGLCESMKNIFIMTLKNNTWMLPATRKYAIYKIKNLHIFVGNSIISEADPLLDYGDSLYENLKKLNDWRHKKFIELEGKPVVNIPTLDWNQYPVKMISNQAYIVNAAYMSSTNAIYINLGYLQTPFVDIERGGIEYNLAHLGFTIAHEMNHALDNNGVFYDANGKLHNWATKEDHRRGGMIKDDILKQYEAFSARDGIIFDAAPTIGEDMADISGYFLKANEVPLPIQNLYFRTFFSFFAYQMRQKISKRVLAAQLLINPHPIDKYRCNIPLSRSNTFRAIYNVKKGDGMWWNNLNAVWV